jgi:uncharacterized integral membrane protein (TIGR00698 family)
MSFVRALPFLVIPLIVFLPVSGAQALFFGLLLAVGFGWTRDPGKLTTKLLQGSVVGLGAGMDFNRILQTGLAGFGSTLVGLLLAIGIGWSLQRLLQVPREEAVLITAGTAICGGSAIAAVGPAIGAGATSMSVALGTVFVLNSAALLIFPPIGQALALTQEQFGLWSALAIHDTSSVVGATLAYGPEAAQIGTTVKLTRTLWIIPLTWVASRWFSNQSSDDSRGRTKKPWFILGFLMVAAAVTWIPGLQVAGKSVEWLSRRSLVLTLFWIGLGLSREKLRKVGFRPFLFGLILWGTLAGISLSRLTFTES